jgi:hypothetical protein
VLAVAKLLRESLSVAFNPTILGLTPVAFLRGEKELAVVPTQPWTSSQWSHGVHLTQAQKQVDYQVLPR